MDSEDFEGVKVEKNSDRQKVEAVSTTKKMPAPKS